MKTLKEKIIDILAKSKDIKREHIEEALKIQKEKGIGLDKILVQKGLVTEKELLILLAKELNVPPIDLSRYRIDPDLLKIIPERIARQHHIIPISQIGNTLTLATADPLNIFALDDIKNLTGSILLINQLPLEQYIKYVATSEMSAECPPALLEAQTVAARSWLLSNRGVNHIYSQFDVCNDDCCQRYQGITELSNEVESAIHNTYGKVLLI